MPKKSPHEPASNPGLPLPSGGKTWPLTLWEIVRIAREAPAAESAAAREMLLTRYYVPVYRFFKRVLGAGADRVEDVTQDFFTRFIEKDFLKNLREEKSFRSFLKVACRRHYINWCESQRAHHGGRHKVVSMEDVATSASEFPVSEEQFMTLIDEELRSAILAETLAKVRAHLVAKGKLEALAIFEARVKYDGEAPRTYEELALEFGLRVYDVRNRLASTRKLFRTLLLEAARERCEDPREELLELDLLKYVE